MVLPVKRNERLANVPDIHVFYDPFFLYHCNNKFVSSFEKKKICNQEILKLLAIVSDIRDGKKHGKGTMFDSTAGKSRSGERKDDKPYGRQVIVNY